MIAGALRGAVLAAATYLLCAAYVVAYLRRLFDPASPLADAALAIVAVGLVAALARLVRSRALRLLVLVGGAALGAIVVAGLRLGAWPVREDVGGRDGYLGSGGYVEEVTRGAGDAIVAWTRTDLPADAAAEPDAVAVVRLMGLGLLLVCAAALIAFRVPLVAIAAAAGAATFGTLLVPTDDLPLHAAGLCLLALVVLGAPGLAALGRRAAAPALAGSTVAALAIAAVALPGGAPGAALDWRSWRAESPDPVSVAFVWEQDLVPLDFGGDEVEVLQVDDPSVAYLRVGSLGRFDGQRWEASATPLATADAAGLELPEGVRPTGDGEAREIEVRNLAVATALLPVPPGTIAVSGLPRRARPATVGDDGRIVLAEALPIGATFSAAVLDPAPATDAAVEPDPADLTLDGTVYPAFGAPGRDEEVPRVLRRQIEGGIYASSSVYGWEEVYAEARRVAGDAATPQAAAARIEEWFRTSFRYDESASYDDVSVLGPLPTFLLSEERAGHCQYFAGSMAVIMRMLGIPARVAFGFAGGEPDGGRRVFTNRDAHAWVEVHVPGSGWVAFDPTPSGRASASAPTPSGVDPSSIVLPGGAPLGARGEGADAPNGGDLPGRGSEGAPTGASAAAEAESAPWGRRLGVLAAVLAGLGVLGLVLWLVKQLPARRALRDPDPRRVARGAHVVVAGWAADQGMAVPVGTPVDVGTRIESAFGVPAAAWAAAVERARYGAPAEAAGALPAVRVETERLVARMRSRLTRRERLRGALHPRLPGGRA